MKKIVFIICLLFVAGNVYGGRSCSNDKCPNLEGMSKCKRSRIERNFKRARAEESKRAELRSALGTKKSAAKFSREQIIDRCVNYKTSPTGECWVLALKHLNLKEFSKEELLDLGNKSKNTAVWVAIWKTKKFSTKEYLDVATLSWVSWEKIGRSLKLKELSQEELLEFGTRANHWTVWRDIDSLLDLKGFSVEELIDLGNKTKNWYVWEMIATSPTVKKLSNEEILQKFPKKDSFGYDHFFKKLIRKRNFSNEQLLDIGDRIDHSEVWHKVFKKISLRKLSNEQLLDLGKSMPCNCFDPWKKIAPHLKLKGLSKEQLLEIGDKAKNSHVWKKVNKNL
jgi:hypothetical protein